MGLQMVKTFKITIIASCKLRTHASFAQLKPLNYKVGLSSTGIVTIQKQRQNALDVYPEGLPRT
jgi:hypothetical protein